MAAVTAVHFQGEWLQANPQRGALLPADEVDGTMRDVNHRSVPSLSMVACV